MTGALAAIWALVPESERSLLSGVADGAARLVRALGAGTVVPSLEQTQDPARWESAYSAAAREVNGPGLLLLAGRSGTPSEEPPTWDELAENYRGEASVAEAIRALGAAYAAARQGTSRLASLT